jgi:hypothetical protein
MRDVSKLHPKLQTKLRELQEKCEAQGLKIGICECLRTVAEQDALYAQGRTKPGKKVTNCRGSSYSSMHQWGVAFDFYRNDGKGAYSDKDGFFSKVGKIGQSIGLEWGGSWKSIVDTPHFQLPDWGSTATKLKKQYGRPEAFFATWEEKRELVNMNDIAYRMAKEGIAISSAYWIGRMETEPNVYALCKNIANYTLNHPKGKDSTSKLKTANDVAYRLLKAGIISNSYYWLERMQQDVNLFALGRKAAEWTL